MSASRESDRNETTWTARQREVLDLLAEGRTNPQIAQELGITLDGAKWHVREVLTKLGVANREGAAEYWRRERSQSRKVRSLLALVTGRAVLSVAGVAAGIGVFVVLLLAVLSPGESSPAESASSTELAAAVPTSFAPTPTVVPGHLPPGSGPKVAWVSAGNIWVTGVSGGMATQITDDKVNYRPKWSPSGKWLAFIKANAVWVVGEGRAAEQVSELGTGGFEWSPVEDLLGYTASRGELRTLEPSARAVVTLTTIADRTYASTFAWRHDGQALAVARWPYPPPPGTGPAGQARIDIVDVQSSRTLRQLYEFEQGGPIIAEWLGSDRVLFWERATASASIQADGLPLQAISTAAGAVPEGIAGTLVFEDFVDAYGDVFAFVEGGKRGVWDNKRLAIGSTFGASVVSTDDEAVSSPAISPDGGTVAYVSMPAAPGVFGGEEGRLALMQRRIWTLDLASGAAWQLTGDPTYRDEYPRWSADGESVVFLRIDAGPTASIWVMPAAGGRPEEIASGVTVPDFWFGYYGRIAWEEVFDYWPG